MGVKESQFFGWSEFSKIEKCPSGVQFYIGSAHLNIFKSYVNSSFPSKVYDLFVGSSTESYQPEDSTVFANLDYSIVTEILSRASYPKLKVFRYGVTELFCNAEGVNGAVGDITELLEKMPNLECLEVGGSFTLSKPLNLPKLKELAICIVDGWDTSFSKEPTEETFTNLFKSNLPSLNDLTINFNCYGDFERNTNYTFPDDFLTSKSMPNLSYIEISGLFKQGEIKRLKESSIWDKCPRKYSSICEAYYLAIDVHYEKNTAFVAGVSFTDSSQTKPDQVYYSELEVPGEYEPGEFYKRELPCITKLLDEHCLNPSVIIIDGYVYLDEANKWGLGARLAHHFSQQGREISVVGVAKNPRKDTPKDWEVLRGGSLKPLYVKGVGLDDEFSRNVIVSMSGDYRQPTLLKLADTLCRERAKSSK
ncbi:endonuclease V [Litoribacillus peritrichatus]|uniref:endonuclease V n=1 Tax=Litoribacillus peritrichatus TaxID=718191 RepID=UPI0031D8A403